MDQQGFGQSRNTDDETVAAGEYGQQHLLDDPLLADDEFAELVAHAPVALSQVVGQRDIVGRVQGILRLRRAIHLGTSSGSGKRLSIVAAVETSLLHRGGVQAQQQFLRLEIIWRDFERI